MKNKKIDSQLLPCPFCGGGFFPFHPKMEGKSPCRSKPALEELSFGGWRVSCYGCGVGTWDNLGYTKEQAIKAWNTRSSIPLEILENIDWKKHWTDVLRSAAEKADNYAEARRIAREKHGQRRINQ